ncbi:MAG TPA: hypothetical protein DEA08_26275 [Planctomycetes bacterium]|nr:hypothetical protein [Planctomycetota bacterium]
MLVLIGLAVAGALGFNSRLRASSAWKATVTPLSSIMGSGFLVSAPLVASVTGPWAPLAMGGLLLMAFALGAMIRFNIRYAESLLAEAGDEEASEEASDEEASDEDASALATLEHRLHAGHALRTMAHWAAPRTLAARTEQLSHLVLAAAYVVSVSYYLQLLSAFVLDRFGLHDPLYNRVATSGVLVVITVIGGLWGLRALEKVETYAVSLNLGTIVALLVGLLLYAGSQVYQGSFALPRAPSEVDPLRSLRVMMGLLIVVQGFETSRFLGEEHSVEERVRTMRNAQLIASGIYLTFVTLMLPLLQGDLQAEVTAVVRLVAPVAAVLPVLIVIAAVGSQFSASVADDAGCAGLLGTIFGDRLSPRWSYLGIGLCAIALTWLTDVVSVISLASRAFALFYALQCAVTAITAYTNEGARHRRLYLVGGALCSLLALAVTLFGIPAE